MAVVCWVPKGWDSCIVWNELRRQSEARVAIEGHNGDCVEGRAAASGFGAATADFKLSEGGSGKQVRHLQWLVGIELDSGQEPVTLRAPMEKTGGVTTMVEHQVLLLPEKCMGEYRPESVGRLFNMLEGVANRWSS